MRVRLRQHRSSRGTVGFGSLGGTVGWKVFDNAREWSDRFGGDGEGPCLRSVLVIEEDGRNIKVVSNLV